MEADGRLALRTALGEVLLTGRADRIDRAPDGALSIYDYKAGVAPSQKQVDIFAKQLPVLAAMARAGAFDEIGAGEVRELAYLSLSGAGDGGRTTRIENDPDALIGLTALIDAFADENVPYPPRAYVERALTYSGDFEHLSRFGEWADEPPGDAPPGTT